MKLENQVCTLKQSKKLVELGIEDLANFYWMNTKDGYILANEVWGEYYPAFTVAELGEMLPTAFDSMRLQEGYWRGYDDNGKDYPSEGNFYKYEAGLRADMLIAAIEQGIINIKECNENLTKDKI